MPVNKSKFPDYCFALSSIKLEPLYARPIASRAGLTATRAIF
jgi:hypothetical protein